MSSVRELVTFMIRFNPFPPRGFRVRQSKIIKGSVLADLGGNGLRNRDEQIGPVKPQCGVVAILSGCCVDKNWIRPWLLHPRSH